MRPGTPHAVGLPCRHFKPAVEPAGKVREMRNPWSAQPDREHPKEKSRAVY